MTRSAYIACACVLTLLPGCGGGIIADRRPDTLPAGAAAELDALEQTIAEEERLLPSIDPAACTDRCRSVEAICEASERICVISAEVGGDEVALRCARAERACDEARGGTSPSCGCATATTDAGIATCSGPPRF